MATKSPTTLDAQISFAFDAPIITPLGDGSFNVRPGKPVIGEVWVPTRRATAILKISRAQIWRDRDKPLGSATLRWRYKGPSKRRVEWELQSVHAWDRAREDFGK